MVWPGEDASCHQATADPSKALRPWICGCALVADRRYEEGEELKVPERCPEHGAPYKGDPWKEFLR